MTVVLIKKQTSENIVTGITPCDHEVIDLRCVFVTHIWKFGHKALEDSI